MPFCMILQYSVIIMRYCTQVTSLVTKIVIWKYTMIYAFIDSNIFIRVMSQGKTGCEPHLFDDLCTLTQNKAIELTIPEVVLFEIERQMKDLPKLLRDGFQKIKDPIKKTIVWNEIEDAKLAVLTHLDNACEEKIESWNKSYDRILTFLKSADVKRIPYTPEIMCLAKSRIIRGAIPNPKKNKQDQDAAIVESLASFFTKCKDENPVLLFCSENYNDFAVEITKGVSLDRRFALHPSIKPSLPLTHYFIKLADLLKINQGYETLPLPVPDDDISEALSKLQTLEEAEDVESDEYIMAFGQLDMLYDKRLSQDFSKNILPELPEEIREKRRKSYEHIQHLLSKCRKCKSWYEKSEDKLPQWLENIPESMMQYTSISNLFKIEKSLERYLLIHEEMDVDLR